MEPEVEGGFYTNRDSAYIYSHLSREFGRVLVVRAAAQDPADLRSARSGCRAASFASGRCAPASRG